MALCTRSGVSTRPSRLGFSPRRTSISWTRSSKLAPVRVVGSFLSLSIGFCSSGAGFMRSLFSRFGRADILEGVHHGLFESYSFKMRLLKATLQYFEDFDGEIFRGGHKLGEFLHRIQILQVIAGEHFPFDESIEIDQVADHAGSGIDRAADRDFEVVVVAVPVGVVAFSVGGKILGSGHVGAVQAVRCRETVAAGEVSDHTLSESTGAKAQRDGTGLTRP